MDNCWGNLQPSISWGFDLDGNFFIQTEYYYVAFVDYLAADFMDQEFKTTSFILIIHSNMFFYILCFKILL